MTDEELARHTERQQAQQDEPPHRQDRQAS
jgi:hypothetical protein